MRRRRAGSTAARARRPPRQTGGAARLSVAVVNQQALARVSTREIRRVARHVLRAEGVTRASLRIALLDDAAIRRLHRRFLNDDSPTDVLTFPADRPDEGPLRDAPDEVLSGDIAISAETATRAGPEHGLSPEAEVLLYLTHGILHLCGYTDHTRRDARRMHRRQRELLRQFGVLRAARTA